MGRPARRRDRPAVERGFPLFLRPDDAVRGGRVAARPPVPEDEEEDLLGERGPRDARALPRRARPPTGADRRRRGEEPLEDVARGRRREALGAEVPQREEPRARVADVPVEC